jgi:hypothetical protein
MVGVRFMTFDDVWRKCKQSKKYRAQFALAVLKRSIPFQVEVLRKKHCGSQMVLAKQAGLTQGVVSRAEDQDYGNLTINTIGRLAGGLDMAFIGKFVPVSELIEFSLDLSEEKFRDIATFDEEDAAIGAESETIPDAAGDVAHLERIGPRRQEAEPQEEIAEKALAVGAGNGRGTYGDTHNVFVMPPAMRGAMQHGSIGDCSR